LPASFVSSPAISSSSSRRTRVGLFFFPDEDLRLPLMQTIPSSGPVVMKLSPDFHPQMADEDGAASSSRRCSAFGRFFSRRVSPSCLPRKWAGDFSSSSSHHPVFQYCVALVPPTLLLDRRGARILTRDPFGRGTALCLHRALAVRPTGDRSRPLSGL